ncbi:MAG: sigma-70 family RNA polymerase sigma factor [Candidatus Peribacteraceae bacterium]|nr:sigma-70 family RNA polymerase sigma factor [Candidatus Peribacteraceae bacterium]
MALTKKELREIETLVRRAQKDDAEAFGEVYDRFVVPIYRYIYYRVAKSEAEDLTETVFLRAWEKRHTYRKQKGNSFNAWIFRIAHNAVVDFYRTNAKTDIVELSDDLPETRAAADPVAKLDGQFEQKKLIRALRELPEIQQQVVVLKFVNGFENGEIAEILEKSVGAVRVVQFRALNRLKDLLEKSEKNSNKSESFAFKTAEDV